MSGLGILLYISDLVFHNGRDSWLTFSAIVGPSLAHLLSPPSSQCSGLGLMSLTCLANIKSIMLSPSRGDCGNQFRINSAH